MTEPTENLGPVSSIRTDGDFAVIRIHRSRVHELRVALAPCPCRATKSTATADVRADLEKALSRVGWPL